MDEKTFEFLEKILTEVQGVKQELQSVKNQVTKIEDDHGKKLEALLDGYKLSYQKLSTVENKVDTIAETVDKHDIKIQVIQGGKASNS